MNAVDHEFPRILSEDNLSLFRKNIEKFDVENHTERFLQKYVDKCFTELDNLQNQKMRLGLYSVMGKVFKEQKRGQ
jgi:hypothetical protein